MDRFLFQLLWMAFAIILEMEARASSYEHWNRNQKPTSKRKRHNHFPHCLVNKPEKKKNQNVNGLATQKLRQQYISKTYCGRCFESKKTNIEIVVNNVQREGERKKLSKISFCPWFIPNKYHIIQHSICFAREWINPHLVVSYSLRLSASFQFYCFTWME